MWADLFRASLRRTNADWGEVARAAAYVVALGQRTTGFWPLPTNQADLDLLYADKGSEEEQARLREVFGFESFTMTWEALDCINVLFAKFPESSLRAALTRVTECRVGGAYGIRSDSAMRSGPRIHAAARHTAIAILILLFHSRGLLSEQRTAFLRDSILWLLADKGNRKPAYLRERPDDDLPMTIAACVAALSCAIQRLNDIEASDLLARCRKAVCQAHDDLYSTFSEERLWQMRYPQMHIVDNCFVVNLLSRAQLTGVLGSVVPTANARLMAAKRGLLNAACRDGWPESVDKRTISLPATISGLVAVEDLIRNDKFQTTADSFVLEQILKKNGAEVLTSWDWITLARLAALRAGSFSESESMRVTTNCIQIRELARRKVLIRTSMNVIPRAARSAILFMLSEGKVEEISFWRFKPWFSTVPSWLRWVLGLLGAAVLAIVGDKIIDLFKVALGWILRAGT
jgi:hypothetical protein